MVAVGITILVVGFSGGAAYQKHRDDTITLNPQPAQHICNCPDIRVQYGKPEGCRC